MEAVEITSLIRVVAASAQMQQRGLPDTPPTPPRGRNNAKLKVLVRSHAMREETSPPREPTPTSVTHPCLNVIPSPSGSPTHISPPSGPNPLLVLSPSLSRGNSPSPTSTSPTSTLVPSPTPRYSPNSPPGAGKPAPRCLPAEADSLDLGFCESQAQVTLSPKSSCNKFYGQAEKLQTGLSVITSCSDELDEEEVDDADFALSSQGYLPSGQGGLPHMAIKQLVCAECSNVKCANCSERNFNNNLSSNINNNIHSSNTLTVNQRALRGKLRHQSSSQGSFDSASASPCLSRDNSSEQYTDTTGIDLAQFIPETLNRNAKDRALMLRIEQELVSLAKDALRSHFKFPPMSSYQRMLVHRCAAYFGMDHNIESSGKCVVVNKTKNTRVPDLKFKEHIMEEFNEEPRRSILKRDSNSCEDCNYKSPDRQIGMGMENRRSKSFEEREEEYEKARRRIFNREMQMQNCDSQEELMWADAPWTCTESENFSRLRLLQPGRLLKVQSVEGRGDTLRPCVAKSYSFGGYGGNVSVLSRGDSVTSTHSAGPRLITKQDSGASSVSWRLSPSSSGYKSQSQRSESITPSPTSTPHTSIEITRQDSNVSNDASTIQGDKLEGQLVWAVTDIHNVPKGSVLINPQTGQPVTNPDGSIYHFDPANPPPGFSTFSNTITAAPCSTVSSGLFKPPASPQNHKSPSPHKAATLASGTASTSSSSNTSVASQPLQYKDRPLSPKRRPPRISPTKKAASVTTTATSPSLPFSPTTTGPPPLHHQPLSLQQAGRSMNMGFAHVPGATSSNNPMDTASGGSMPMSQYATPVYPGNYPAPMEGAVPMYQSPMGVVYTGYSVPGPQSHPQYDSRVDPQMADMSGYFMNMNISGDPSSMQHQGAPQPMSYQGSTPCWNQQAPMVFYQSTSAGSNQQPQTPRYSIPVPNPSGSYLSGPYPTNYTPQNVPQQPPQANPELIQIYPNPVQMVYSSPAVNPNPLMYPNHQGGIIYTQNPVYPSTPLYPAQSTSIPSGSYPPPCTSTPNSTVSTSNYTGSGYGEQNVSLPPYTQSHTPTEIPGRVQRNYTPKGNKFSSPKAAFMQQTMGSSGQSSGGTNSPATTVVSGYYTNAPSSGNSMLYRQTPPETPPNPPPNMGYGYSVVQPVVFRQLTTVRASPPVTQSSRSPTPADTAPNDRQRYSLPPNLYHGVVPYVVQNDPRMSSGRGQPSAYRQPPVRQHSINSQSSNDSSRIYRSRKSRGNKTQTLPPSGKQHQSNIQQPNAQKI